MKVKGLVRRDGTRHEGFVRDGATPGLTVQVSWRERDGVRDPKHGIVLSWLYIYTSPETRKVRSMGLGSCDVISLKEARELAKAARRLVTLGRDPIEHRKVTVAAEAAERLRLEASTMTFEACAEQYLKTHAGSWKNPKHVAQYRETLSRACKAFGQVNVAEIDTPMIAKFLEPIWLRTNETGSRLRGRIEKVLDWAKARKFRSGENPARWRGHLEHLLTARPAAQHHSAMPVAELPAFMARLRERESMSARALELLILTATRTSETIEAQWSEIDLDAKTWTIPAERMKAGREHVVPLSDRAVEIIAALPRLGEHVFASKIEGKPLSNMAMRELLKGMDANGYTPHGFRSTFTDWVGEHTEFDKEVRGHALAHSLPDKVDAAYRRGTSFKKRVLLMQLWANYCAGIVTAADNVRELRPAS